MKTKYLKIILIAIILVMATMPKVNAWGAGPAYRPDNPTAGGTGGSSSSGTGIFSGAEDFLSKGSEQAGSTGQTEAAGAVNEVGAMMVSIAGYILVIGVIVVGIKYMTANPEGKAKLKGQLIGLAIATVVIYGAQFIWSTIITAME